MSMIKYMCVIVAIASAEGMIIFILDISNTFQNNIITNLEEIVYLSLPHIYLECFKRKWSMFPLASIYQKELYIQTIKPIQGKKMLENSGTTHSNLYSS